MRSGEQARLSGTAISPAKRSGESVAAHIVCTGRIHRRVHARTAVAKAAAIAIASRIVSCGENSMERSRPPNGRTDAPTDLASSDRKAAPKSS